MGTFFIEKGQTEDFQSGFGSRFHTTISGGKIFSMPVAQGRGKAHCKKDPGRAGDTDEKFAFRNGRTYPHDVNMNNRPINYMIFWEG